MKDRRDYRKWSNQEIEADPEGYVEAQRAYHEDRALAERLRHAQAGEAVFTKVDIDRIVSDRLAHEQRKRRRDERERDELEAEVEEILRLLHSGHTASL